MDGCVQKLDAWQRGQGYQRLQNERLSPLKDSMKTLMATLMVKRLGLGSGRNSIRVSDVFCLFEEKKSESIK